MSPTREIDMIFFDIGGTLGEADPHTRTFVPYPSSAEMLHALREDLGLRIGIITTLGPILTNAEALELLRSAGLDVHLDPAAFVSDHDASAAKPHVETYQFAAAKSGVPIGRCLYVGENLLEILGAQAAGMKTVLKPCPPGRELP